MLAGTPYVEAVLEEPPKWGLLKEVLEEVGGLKAAWADARAYSETPTAAAGGKVQEGAIDLTLCSSDEEEKDVQGDDQGQLGKAESKRSMHSGLLQQGARGAGNVAGTCNVQSGSAQGSLGANGGVRGKDVEMVAPGSKEEKQRQEQRQQRRQR
eukprot:scaffold44130_cov19-Tisochrysis_lutea.AAC.1